MKVRTILVTGAAGSIGSELTPPEGGFNYVLLDRDEFGLYTLMHKLKDRADVQFELADVCDAHRMKAIFDKYQPEIVLHAAAYKHVPLLEDFPYEAYMNNARATRNLVQWATEAKVTQFIYISTDKAVHPENHLGRSKRLGEIALLEDQGAMIKKIIRFGNVVHSRGALQEAFERQLTKLGHLELTHIDMKRYFLNSKQLIRGIRELITLPKSGIYVMKMGPARPIRDYAQEFLRSKGYHKEAFKVIGIRPGEKLSEELHFNFETFIESYKFIERFQGPIPCPDRIEMLKYIKNHLSFDEN